MVVYCSVCMNNNRKNKNISYFNYPKDSNRRHAWLKAVGREDLLSKLVNEKTRQQYRVCEEHFERTCIKLSKNETIKYLYDNAFPTLNLPTNDGACSSRLVNAPDRDIQKIVIMPDITHMALHPSPKQKNPLAPDHQEATQTKKCNLDSVTAEDFLKLCDKFMTKGMSQIIKWQIDMKANHSRDRHSQAFKLFGLNLYYCGPAVYSFLANTLCLPSLDSLRKFVKPLGTKIDDRLIGALKAKVDKMGTQEKICSVSVNYMSLKANLFYDISNDRVVGFHEINGVQIKEPAKYVIVMMIRGIVHDWKQPISHAYLSQCINYPEVNDWIDETISSLLDIGLDIRVFVSELRSDFLNDSRSRFVSSDKTYFKLNGQKIYYMFDVPHLLKCIRNDLTTHDFVFEDKVAQWSHIRDMYNEDKKRKTRLAPKLTDIHINPNNSQKMRVELVTQALSRIVASAINSHVDLGTIDNAARDTAIFINKVSDLFDILNSSTLRSPDKFKRAFCGKSYQAKFLQEMLTLFKNLHFKKIARQRNDTNMNFVTGFQVSIKSLLQLSEELKLEGIEFIFTRRLNLNCIEEFFDKVRQVGGNRRKPTCHHVSLAFKRIFTTNILKKPLKTNCGQDFESLLLKQNDYFDVSHDSSTNDDGGSQLCVGTTDYRFDLPEKNALMHVSSYLYIKCLERHKCEKIKLYINKLEQPIDTDKDFNEDSAQPGFIIVPSDKFIAFVKILEHKFREYFDHEISIVNVGSEILKRMQYCKFKMPCPCFPIDHLKKLFIRLRIYHTIKRNNKLLKDENNKTFIVTSL